MPNRAQRKRKCSPFCSEKTVQHDCANSARSRPCVTVCGASQSVTIGFNSTHCLRLTCLVLGYGYDNNNNIKAFASLHSGERNTKIRLTGFGCSELTRVHQNRRSASICLPISGVMKIQFYSVELADAIRESARCMRASDSIPFALRSMCVAARTIDRSAALKSIFLPPVARQHTR